MKLKRVQIYKNTCYKMPKEKITSLIMYVVNFVEYLILVNSDNTATEEKSNGKSAFVTQMKNQDINLKEGTF